MIEIPEGEEFTLKCEVNIPENKVWKITGRTYKNVQGQPRMVTATWSPILDNPKEEEKENASK